MRRRVVITVSRPARVSRGPRLRAPTQRRRRLGTRFQSSSVSDTGQGWKTPQWPFPVAPLRFRGQLLHAGPGRPPQRMVRYGPAADVRPFQ
jgi:hypothetical protein